MRRMRTLSFKIEAIFNNTVADFPSVCYHCLLSQNTIIHNENSMCVNISDIKVDLSFENN